MSLLKNKPLLILIGVSVVFAGVILLGPNVEEKQANPTLWNKSFVKIEYDDPTNEHHVVITRDAGFTKDDFLVFGTSKGKPVEKRKGGQNAKNIFSDWSKPKVNAIYDTTPEKKRELGLDENAKSFLLYESSDAKPIRVIYGKNTSSGHKAIATDRPEDANKIYLIGSFLVDRLKMAPKELREKRLIHFTTDSFTEKLVVRYQGSDTGFSQKRDKVDGKEKATFYDLTGKSIPLQVATPLDQVVRVLEIAMFRDDFDIDIESAWDEARDREIQFRIDLFGGGHYDISMRKQKQNIAGNGRDLVMIRKKDGEGIDFVDITHYNNATKAIEQFNQALKVLAGNHSDKGQGKAQ